MSIEIGGFSGAARQVRVGISGRATLLILAIVSAALVACSSYLYLSQSSTLQGGRRRQHVEPERICRPQRRQLAARQARSDADDGSADHRWRRESDTDRVLDRRAHHPRLVLRQLLRASGRVLHQDAKAEIPPGYDPRQRPWYKEAAATDGPILTEPYISASRGTFIITAAAPVKDAAHGLGGVVGSDFDVSVLARMITEVAPGDGGYAYLVSGAGTILIHPRAAFIGKPLSELIDGPVPGIAAVGRCGGHARGGDGPSARSSRASQPAAGARLVTSRFRSTTPPRSHPSRISRRTWPSQPRSRCFCWPSPSAG